MATQTVETVNRLAPYLEGLEKRLLQSAFGEFDSSGKQTTQGLLDTPLGLPDYQIAPLDPMQQAWQTKHCNNLVCFNLTFNQRGNFLQKE